MATANIQEDLSLSGCSVCFDSCVSTRNLPVCLHSFCEACILTFIKSLNEDVVSEFQCPVCRQRNIGPGSTGDVHDWLLSLELNIPGPIQNGKRTEDAELCVRCKENEKSTLAIKYCFDCQEFLCEMCCRIGHGFKQLKHHLLINIEQDSCDRKEREVIRSMSDYLVCQSHPDKELSLLCREDNTLCCSACTEISHRSCNDIVVIKDCASKENNLGGAQNLLDRFSKLTDISQAIIQTKKENEVENKKSTEKIVEEIQELRRKINDVFDVLQDTVISNVKDCAKHILLQIKTLLANCKKSLKLSKFHAHCWRNH